MAARRVPYRRRRAEFFGRSSGAPNFGKIIVGGGVARRRTALSCLRMGKLQKPPRDGVLGRRPRLEFSAFVENLLPQVSKNESD